MAEERIALYGGSFDPIHDGHILIAKEAQKKLSLDKVIFIPAKKSPLKKRSLTEGSNRLDMLNLATENETWVEISDWELKQSHPSYSWKTAEHFAQTLGKNTTLFWILGDDQWNSLPKWAEPEKLAHSLKFIVFPRDGHSPLDHKDFVSHRVEISHPASSTEIRNKIQRGERPIYLSESVMQYIIKNKLYT